MNRVLVSIYIDPEYYPPTKNAILSLAQSTEKVVVLTRNLFSPNLNDYPSNVTFHRIGKLMTVQDSETKGTISKIWDFLKFWLTYQYIILFKRIDTVIFYDAIPLFSFFVGLKPKNITYWYHNHDMPDIRFVRKYSIGWFSSKYEKDAMSKINYFSLPSVDRLIYYPNWINMDRFLYIPNYPRLAQINNLNQPNRFEKFTIIFQGAIGEGHGIEDVIRILKNLKEVNFILKGPVREAYRNKIDNLIEEHQVIDQVEWVGITPYSELISLTSKCHLGIGIHQGKDEVSKTLGTASNKIYEYLACGLPIILFDNHQFRKNLGEAPHVFYYDGNAIQLQNIIQECIKDFESLSLSAKIEFKDKFTFETNFNTALNTIYAN